MLEKGKKYVKKGKGYYWPTRQMKKIANVSQRAIYQKALQDPEKFWKKQAKDLKWQKKWTKVFSHKPPHFEWFLNGKINITENCLDENLKTKRHKIAFIWEPEPVNEPPDRSLTISFFRRSTA